MSLHIECALAFFQVLALEGCNSFPNIHVDLMLCCCTNQVSCLIIIIVLNFYSCYGAFIEAQ